jgi:hypothetical protein
MTAPTMTPVIQTFDMRKFPKRLGVLPAAFLMGTAASALFFAGAALLLYGLT